MNLTAILSTAAAAGSAVTAGVYLNFSTRVMPRLAKLPDAEGISRMQQFNRTALQPPFMLCFFGAAAAGAWLVVRCMREENRAPVDLLGAAGGVLHLAGFALTIAYNVPRNERLAALPATAPQTIPIWHAYLTEWTRANHVRAGLSACSSIVLLAAALTRR